MCGKGYRIRLKAIPARACNSSATAGVDNEDKDWEFSVGSLTLYAPLVELVIQQAATLFISVQVRGGAPSFQLKKFFHH